MDAWRGHIETSDRGQGLGTTLRHLHNAAPSQRPLRPHLGKQPGVIRETLFGVKCRAAPNPEALHDRTAAGDLVFL